MQLLGKPATPTMNDPRGAQGILARGKNMYLGGNAAAGAGRPPENNLRFDTEVLQRRLMENAASNTYR